jgi:RHS repeat-associated protein
VANYTNNTLNQITSRGVPAYVDVMGDGLATNGVTVNGLAVYRKNEYFREQLGVTNTSAVWDSVTVAATGQTSVTGHAYVAQNPENYSYDADGNLLTDGRWTYTWDAENRLVSMTSLSGAPIGSLLKLVFTNDYQGRRIQKIVSTNNGSSYIGEYTNKYAYDGWNCLAILSPSLSLSNAFLWGSDLSGRIQGAGGVGGLIKVAAYGAATTNCFVAYDGNGNVSALINAANGSTLANYEYGPFGEVIRATGPMAKLNPFRFSSKYQDDETDFLCFGFRYYNPSTGRWLSRDPAEEEEGGFNLYAACQNDCINGNDLLGLWTIQRGNRNRADAIPSSGDTVQSLATMIKLDDSDYTKWLKPVGPTSMPASATTPINSCAEFTIPNTMYIEFGQMTSWIDRFGPIPPWRKFLIQEQIKYEVQGFNVVLRNPSDPGTARNDLQDPNIYEFAYAGHGGGAGSLVFSAGEGETTLATARITPFGIASFVALACDTASQTPVNNSGVLGYKYSEWEKNVATRGLFVGVWGVVNGYQAWSHLIITPGTNTR